MKTRPTSITPYRYSTQADFASQEQPVGPTLCAVAACGLSADSRGMIANRPIARTRGRIMRTVAPCHRRLAKLLTDHLSWRGLASRLDSRGLRYPTVTAPTGRSRSATQITKRKTMIKTAQPVTQPLRDDLHLTKCTDSTTSIPTPIPIALSM